MLRLVLATLLSGIIGASVFAAPPDAASDTIETPTQILNFALRQSIGGPARADLDDQASERLADGLILVPRDAAIRLMKAANKIIPPGLLALLFGAEEIDAPGVIRFVPGGFIDADAALAWTQDDILASLKDTVERRNPDRIKKNQEALEVRRWVRPPRYDPEAHQISWAALILPKSAPRESDGEISYYAISFGREGYVEFQAVTSLEKADIAGRMADDFLAGLTFKPGKAYGDVVPTDRRAAGGLAAAMDIDTLHKARSNSNFWASDKVFPIVGGVCAAIGAVSLFFYIQRHLRREARRS